MASASNTPSLRKSKKDDVEALLSDLDNLDPASGTTPSAHSTAGRSKADDAQSLLDDLDDLVKRRAPTPKRTDKPLLRVSSSSSTPLRNNTAPSTPLPTDESNNRTTLTSDSSGPLEDAPLSSSPDAAQMTAAYHDQSAIMGPIGGTVRQSWPIRQGPNWRSGRQ